MPGRPDAPSRREPIVDSDERNVQIDALSDRLGFCEAVRARSGVDAGEAVNASYTPVPPRLLAMRPRDFGQTPMRVPPDGHRLSRLRRMLEDRLAEALGPQGPVVYLDYPIYSNVGDWLIFLGAEAWMAREGRRVLGRWSYHNFPFPRLPPETVILCQGGGNFGDLYVHQGFREAMVEAYPGHRIVFLPQSVHFEDPAALETSIRRLERHPDLHILLRDQASLDLLRDRLPRAHCRLAPDSCVLLAPLPLATARTSRGGGGRLCLMREDDEARPDQAPVGPCTWRGDWDRLLGRRGAAAAALGLLLRRLPSLSRGAVTARVWRTVAHRGSAHCARRLLEADLVETSRLHGFLLANLLGLPCLVHENSYGKLTAYLRCWHGEDA